MTESNDVVLLVATEHRQGSIDARRLGDDRSIRLAFGPEEAVGAITDEVSVVVVDPDHDPSAVEDVVEAAGGTDCVVVAITRDGDRPPWADTAVGRPVDADEFERALDGVRD